MTAVKSDNLAEVEKQRALLEQNVTTLRKTLQLWQKWSFEYEALKEDIEALPANVSAKQLKQAGEAFEGDLLNQKEVNEILGLDKGLTRSTEQISSLLSRRLDYVQQNVGTVQKQLYATEMKLLDMEGDDIPLVKKDDILPVTEILEELDEDGNVLSSKLSRPGEDTNELVNVLRKAGLKDDDVDEVKEEAQDHGQNVNGSTAGEEAISTPGIPASIIEKVPTATKSVTETSDDPSTRRRKSVTFTEDTKPETQPAAASHKYTPKSPSPLSSQTLQSETPQTSNPNIKVYTNFSPHNRVIELNEEDEEIGSLAPAIPIEESVEDAAMRREMLAYSMNEMGSIVAQLDLEESYYSGEDDDDIDEDDEDIDYDNATDDDDDEEETEFGMSTKSAMDEEYRKEMLELESRLGARYFENLGPKGTDGVDVQDLAQHTARVAVKDEEDMPKRPSRTSTEAAPPTTSTASPESTEPKAKKGVRFAEELDVAPIKPKERDSTTNTTTPPPVRSATAGVRDTILERAPKTSTPAASAPPTPPTTAPKVSRFKAARTAAPSSTQSRSTFPEPTTNSAHSSRPASSRLTTPFDSPISPHIIEHAPLPSSSSSKIPAEPDELDPELMRRQISEEYYRQRNRRIGKQGGFRREVQEEMEMEMNEDEDVYGMQGARDTVEEDGELEEEEQPKMSLFRKARLQKAKGW